MKNNLSSEKTRGLFLPQAYRYADPAGIEPKEVARLYQEVGWDEYTGADIKDLNESWRARGVTMLDVGVRDKGGLLVGFGSIFYRDKAGMLNGFAVIPACQSLGIGKAIIDERLRRAELVGVESLYIPYLKLTNTLESYYLEQGFQRTELGELVRGPHPVSITGERPRPELLNP
ncbi:MAG: GNAT family N-acetyltransferase [Candidatus Saccharimonadales bacterium]